MALTVAELLNLGRGSAEYVFHPAGIPWCAHTSGLDWTGVSSAMRRRMFGQHTYDGGGSDFADDVDPYPFLQRPGNCTVNMKDGQAVLTGGDWSVSIVNAPAPINENPHNTRSGIQGLEGLAAIASTANDHDIGWGTLSESFGKADTTLDLENDVGNRISDRITAAGGDPVLLWSGAECMAATAVAADGDEWDVTVTAGHRGLFLSKEQSHYLDDIDTDIYVADAPLNGLAGRPGNLWMFVVDTDGAPLVAPVLIRTGKIEKTPQLANGLWQVDVLPWWSWLDYEMELTDFAGELDKYVFSRAPATTDHPPHMQIDEYSGGAWGGTWEDVWLCAAGDTVTFDNMGDLRDAVRDACNATSLADLNTWDYQCGPRGPYSEDGNVKFRGPLPAICRWGSSALSDNFDECQDHVLTLRLKPNPWDMKWWDYYAESIDNQGGMDAAPVDYIYHFYRTADTDYDDDELGSWSKKWPPSVEDATGSCYLYVKDGESIESMSDGDFIDVGTDQFVTYQGLTTLARTEVGAASGKTITITSATADQYMGEDALRGIKSEVSGDSAKKFVDGQYIYYRPAYASGGMALDPWPVRHGVDFNATKLSSLFKTIFGDTTDFTLSERVQADHIPWDYDHGNWTGFIDWDTLDAVAAELGELGLEYSFRYTGTINLWKEFQNCLRFLGVTPTYEWDADNWHYMIRFRRVGTISASIATMSGRKLDADTIAENTTPATNRDTTPLFNEIGLKANWNNSEGKWSRTGTIKGNSSRTTGGKSVKVDIGSRFIHTDVDDDDLWELLVGHFGNIINRTMVPHPHQSISATIKDKFAHGVGVEALVTLASVQDPYTGVPGLDAYPCMVTSMSVDLDKCVVKYTYRVAPGVDNGWGPACIIPKDKSTVVDGDTIEVDDISDGGAGRDFTNSYPTFGWYDHWMLGNLKFNSTMSEPLEVAGLADKQVVLLERGSTTPTLITGLTVKDVDPRTWAVVDAAAVPFFDLEGAHVGYDTGKSWVVFFAPRDTAAINTLQTPFVFIADTVLELQDSAANEFTGDMWV